MSLYSSFRDYISKNNLIETNDKILVGVSGGLDSVVLLHLLHKLANSFHLKIGIAHINYSLRGSESEKDELLVTKLANSLHYNIYLKKVKLKKILNDQKTSLQETARDIRYNFFSIITHEYGFNKIAIAHNANDNAETVLLNLFRGTGITGFKGIPIKRDNIIRPLLFAERGEILKYAKSNKIRFRTDQSNFKSVYKRNFLRLEVLPRIQDKVNPNVIRNINRFSSIFRDFDDFVNDYIKNIIDSVIINRDVDEICLDIQKLNNYIKYIQEKIIFIIVDNLIRKSPGADKIEKILNLIQSKTGIKIVINKDLSVWKNRNALCFIVRRGNFSNDLPLEVKEMCSYQNFEITITPVDKIEVQFSGNRSIEFIDKRKIVDKIFLRKWQDSDYFYPFGLLGKKKVSDYLTDQKVASHHKKDVFVLESSGKLIWIVGYRLDDRFKCDANTKDVLKLEINYH
jgi:tRNA(Ile)-lysidine synthase